MGDTRLVSLRRVPQVDVARRLLRALARGVLYTQPVVRLVAVKRDALVVPRLVGLGVELGLVGRGRVALGLSTRCLDGGHAEADVAAGEAVTLRPGFVRLVPARVACSAEQVRAVAGRNPDGLLEGVSQERLELLLLGDILRLPDGVGDFRHGNPHGVGDCRTEVFPQHSVPSFGCEVAAAGLHVFRVALVLVAEFCELRECFLALVELPVGRYLDQDRGLVLGDSFDGRLLVAQALDAAIGNDEVARSTRDVVRFFAGGQGDAVARVHGRVDVGVVGAQSITDNPPAHAGGSRSGRTTREGCPHGDHCGQHESDLADAFLHFSP